MDLTSLRFVQLFGLIPVVTTACSDTYNKASDGFTEGVDTPDEEDPAWEELDSQVEDHEGLLGAHGEGLEQLESRLEELEATLAATQPVQVEADTTWTVGTSDEMYPDLQSALDAASQASIAAGVTLIIEVSPETFAHTGPVTVNGADLSSVQLIGRDGTSSTVLEFPQTDGLVFSNGARIGLVDGFTIQGGGMSSSDPTHAGIRVRSGAVATLGNDLSVSDFRSACITAELGGVIVNGHDTSGSRSVERCGVGVDAVYGATIQLPATTATDNGTAFRALGGSVVVVNESVATGASRSGTDIGFAAQDHSYLNATSATSEKRLWGFWSKSGSYVHADEALAYDTESSGFRAEGGSVLEAEGAVSDKSDGGSGFAVLDHSALFAPASQSINNGGGGYRVTYHSLLRVWEGLAQANGSDSVEVDYASAAQADLLTSSDPSISPAVSTDRQEGSYVFD